MRKTTVSKNERILLQATLPKGYIRNQDVIALFPKKSKTYCYRLADQLTKKKLVRKKCQCIHKDGHQYTTHFLMLTKKGLELLMKGTDLPALKAAKELYSAELCPYAPMTSREKARHFRIKEIEQFCTGCGVLISTDPRPLQSDAIYGSVQHESQEMQNVADLYEQGLIAFRKTFSLPETMFSFYPATEIKPVNISAEQASRHEISIISSTYLGAILSNRRGFTVYRPQKGLGIGWNEKTERTVQRRVFQFAQNLCEEFHFHQFDQSFFGIILVSDVKEAEAVITGKGLKDFRPETAFDQPFKYLYLLTNDELGRELFRFITAHDDPTEELALRLNNIRGLTTEGSTPLYPAKHKDIRCFLGVLPNTSWICQLRAGKATEPYKILCLPEQEQFYKTLLPGVPLLLLNKAKIFDPS